MRSEGFRKDFRAGGVLSMVEMSSRTLRIVVRSLLALGVFLVVSSRLTGEDTRHTPSLLDCGTFSLLVAVYCAFFGWLSARRNRSAGRPGSEGTGTDLPQHARGRSP
jgi:hypothetical protein